MDGCAGLVLHRACACVTFPTEVLVDPSDPDGSFPHMTRTLRGGNSPRRVQRQKVHSFSASRDALERATKSELIEVAKDLGVYGEVPRNGSNSTPLVADLRDHLADLAGITLT